MKYNFDQVTERRHGKNPVSYSMKWFDDQKTIATMKKMMNLGDVYEDTISMFTADMDFQCAPEITQALVETAQHGIFGYSGFPKEYFEAVTGWFKRRFDWEFDTTDIFPCINATHAAIVQAIESFTQPGNGVIVVLPCYNYHGDIEGKGRKFVGVHMNNNDGYYTMDWEAFEAACADRNNKMFVLCQPHNPSGRVYTFEELQKMGEICRKHGVIVASDEVHIDLVDRGVKATPAMKAMGTQGVISFTGINKTFNLAGLAMTNTIICDPYLKANFNGNVGFYGGNPFSIAAVIAAYNNGDQWVDELNEYISCTFDYVGEKLAKDLPKVKWHRPEGTYIIWLDFSEYGLSDEELAERIAKAHVLIGGGAGFDEVKGNQFRRMILAAPKSIVEEAFNRIAKQFEDLK